MKFPIKRGITSAICIYFIANFSACAMVIDTAQLVTGAEGPLRELARKIREENLPQTLQETERAVSTVVTHAKEQLEEALRSAQQNLEIATKSTCRNLLYLGCGIAGLFILTTTVVMPIISQLRSPSNREEQRSHSAIKLMPSTVGLCSGIALLAGSYIGLRK